MISHPHCPVCKSTHFNAALEAKDHLVSGETFQIWECQECHLRFTNPIPSEDEIGRYYQSEEYISHSGTSEGLVNKLYHLVRRFTVRRKRKLIEKESGVTVGKILDIGSGSGEFLNAMRNAGWEVTGLEPDEGARGLAKSNYQLHFDPPQRLFEFSENEFDVITLWHVLEHVHRLDDYMGQISKILKPTGTLVIAVPNYTSYDASHYGNSWAAYDVPRHLYHFAPQSMKKLLDRFHFKLSKMKRMLFDSFYVSILSEKYRNNSFGIFSGVWIGLKSNWKALVNKGSCSSLIYLAKKII